MYDFFFCVCFYCFFFQAEDGIRDLVRSRGLGDVYKRQDKYGADAVRWYMITSSPPWKPMIFSENDLSKTVLSDFFRALTNTYNFFVLYANIDGFNYDQEKIPVKDRAELDRWIISSMNSMIKNYTEFMEDYDPTKAMRLVSEFAIENLSNWYVRRNRRRFWKSEMSVDKVSAYQTLYECLVCIVKLMAPLSPFISDKMYNICLLYTSPSPRDRTRSRMPSSD